MSLKSELSQLGIGVVDTIGNFVDGIGTNFEANADANLNTADRIRVENELALKNFQVETKRKADRDELIRNVVYVFLFLIVLSLLTYMGAKFYKMRK